MYELDRKFLNSDWLESDPTSKQFIQNKPDVTTNDDPRLSNSREWIAPTVTFEEAIAGNSNERRAFTPFRTRNAIESIAVPRAGGSFTGAVNFDSLVTVTSVDFANSDHNILIGNGVLVNNTNGQKNTAIGFQALAGNTQGSHNTAYGFNSLVGNTSGILNTGVGSRSLGSNTTGESNTAIGDLALFSNTTGIKNISLGHRSLFFNTTGSKNTAIGTEAGHTITGSGNVLIGYRAGFNAIGDNNLYIANTGTSTPLVSGNFGTQELQINGSLAVTNGLEVIGIVEAEDIQADVIQSDRFNTVEIVVDDDLVDVATPANGGAFVLMYTGANNEPEPQVNSSAMVYYSVGNNPSLRSSDAGNGVTITNNNNPDSIVPNVIAIGVDQGIIRIRSTWEDPIIIRMTFIV